MSGTRTALSFFTPSSPRRAEINADGEGKQRGRGDPSVDAEQRIHHGIGHGERRRDHGEKTNGRRPPDRFMRSAEESAVALFKRAVAAAQPQQKIGSEKEQRSREKRKKTDVAAEKRHDLPPRNKSRTDDCAEQEKGRFRRVDKSFHIQNLCAARPPYAEKRA